jgi:hypothetical protein
MPSVTTSSETSASGRPRAARNRVAAAPSPRAAAAPFGCRLRLSTPAAVTAAPA